MHHSPGGTPAVARNLSSASAGSSDREARFVDTGEVVTAAGVSAGIDMALHLVAKLESVERAQEVRRYIQYDPQPPVKSSPVASPRVTLSWRCAVSMV